MTHKDSSFQVPTLELSCKHCKRSNEISSYFSYRYFGYNLDPRYCLHFEQIGQSHHTMCFVGVCSHYNIAKYPLNIGVEEERLLKG